MTGAEEGPASLPQLPPERHSWARHPKAVPTAFRNLPQQAQANAGWAGAGQDPRAEGPPVGLPGPACSCAPRSWPSLPGLGEPPCLPGDGPTGGSGSGRALGCQPGTGGPPPCGGGGPALSSVVPPEPALHEGRASLPPGWTHCLPGGLLPAAQACRPCGPAQHPLCSLSHPLCEQPPSSPAL